MVGEGVLIECLQHPQVDAVLVVGRRSSGVRHPKLKELLHPNMADMEPESSKLSGYDACLFCAGVSSVGKNEPEFFKLTHTLTLGFATTLSRQNPHMTFCYISGAGTNIKGRQMWARVKGKTEYDLQQLPFGAVYCFRPGYLHATPGMKNMWTAYKYVSWMYPVLRRFLPQYVSTLSQLGRAMIKVCLEGFEKKVVEVPDINKLAS